MRCNVATMRKKITNTHSLSMRTSTLAVCTMYMAQFSPFRSVAFLRCENWAGNEANAWPAWEVSNLLNGVNLYGAGKWSKIITAFSFLKTSMQLN